ncbi:glucokinase [Methylocella sp.]|uniref:glucokinase n=1 Tax=Methylocella sp. TaxID=1978226 RepID=UPI003784CFB4
MQFPYPLVLCDVGGTNARFALQAAPDAPLLPGPPVKTADHASFEKALASAFVGFGVRARSALVCAAGPVRGRTVELTNAGWRIDGAETAADLGLDQGLLLNDFEAQALALPALQDVWTTPIGPARPAAGGTRLVMGVGTGLGAAGLIEVEGRHLALPTEAGHLDFAPVGSVEAAIWPHIPISAHGRIGVETILSGAGLARLHRARCAAEGLPPPQIDEIGVVAEAMSAPDGEAARTLSLFWTLVARYAGDLALALMAKGGVTLAGGVLPKIAAFLDPAKFRARFEDKAPFGEFMTTIATRLVIANDVVLPGMAAIAAAPRAYVIDYEARAWR